MILHSHSKWLVNGLMVWQRINTKPLVTILFFKTLDKTGNFAVLMVCCALPVPTSQHISTQKIRSTLL